MRTATSTACATASGSTARPVDPPLTVPHPSSDPPLAVPHPSSWAPNATIRGLGAEAHGGCSLRHTRAKGPLVRPQHAARTVRPPHAGRRLRRLQASVWQGAAWPRLRAQGPLAPALRPLATLPKFLGFARACPLVFDCGALMLALNPEHLGVLRLMG